MSQFNSLESTTTNPLKKKSAEEINEQIDRLTAFYNALENDTNMGYVIDELNKVHDMQVSIQDNITLLQDQLLIFEAKFDEQIDYSDTSITKIREDAIAKVEDSIIKDLHSDVAKVKNDILETQNYANDKIYSTLNSALKKIKKNNEIILNIKQERRGNNYLGFLILSASIAVGMLTVIFFADSALIQKQLTSLKEKNKEQMQMIEYLKKESDERYSVVGAVLDELLSIKDTKEQ